uniref:Mce/MlaD domain-containing protein n=4 Tax=Kalanchoe fedtschenkoi TaxID=63787 RepID=A0A7N0TLC5_KALFE
MKRTQSSTSHLPKNTAPSIVCHTEMVGKAMIQFSSCPSLAPHTFPQSCRNSSPCLPLKPIKRSCVVRASSADSQHPAAPSETKTNPLAILLDVPRNIWRETLRPLHDFGFGRRSIWEGGVGLFLVSGTVLLALSIAWLRGFQLRSKFQKYLAVLEFPQACGICTGTPVRIRGVTVGNVIRVNPSLRSIEAVVEVEDAKIVIPRNSLIEVNQSGLLMETMIDIMPKEPIPTPLVGPLDKDCDKEGLIVCHRQKIKGSQGVSLDELVGIFTRIGREMEAIGVGNTYAIAERVAAVIEDAKPLLAQIQAMSEDFQPLIAEVRDSGLLKEVDTLTRSLTNMSEDLRKVHSSIVTPENTELIQKSVYSLIYTLKNIENISSDILGFTGEENTMKNLKLLIKSLSRLL